MVKAPAPFSNWSYAGLLSGFGGAFATLSVATQQLVDAFHASPVLGKPLIGHWYNPMLALTWLMNLNIRCNVLAAFHRVTCESGTYALLNHVHATIGIGFAITAGTAGMFFALAASNIRRQKANSGRNLPVVKFEGTAKPFTIDLGTATGKLSALGHGAAIKAGATVRLIGDELSQNILVLGGIGSGKTTRAINPIVAQALKQNCGILAFNVKGDYGATVISLAQTAKRNVDTIGITGRQFNLLDGLSPEVASSFLKSALILAGSANGDSAIWNNVAIEYARNALGVLSFVPEYYTLNGLYQYVFSDAFRATLESRLAEVITTLERDQASGDARTSDHAKTELLKLTRYGDYEELIFNHFDDKLKSGVRFQLSSILSLFTLPNIERAFCAVGSEAIQLDQLLGGSVMLVDLPIQEYGLTAKTIYTFIKLKFFSLLDRRRVEKSWNQDRPILFICDEYQELVACNKDGLSDLNFWDKSRSSRCVGVVSAQSIESFRAAIGNAALTDAFLQNFRQTLCFRTEDRVTIDRITHLLGQIEVERENTSTSRSRPMSFARSSGSNKTTSSSTNRQLQATINPQLFRQLQEGEAIAILSIGGTSFDDILKTTPLYVNDAAPAVMNG